jgi:hypothetical protein
LKFLKLTSLMLALNITNKYFLTEISLIYPQHKADYFIVSTSDNPIAVNK